VEFKDFQELLAEVRKGYSSQKEFAKALGIDPSRLSKAINLGEFPFNAENCLRLAKLSDKAPSAILRAAGKGDIAELIESLYGKQWTDLLTKEEQELLRAWQAQTPEEQQALLTLLRRRPRMAPKNTSGGRFRRSKASDTRKGHRRQ
jgi:plasmid maintenance system antidote protein VapI